MIAQRPDVFDALIDRQPAAMFLSVADLNRALTQLKLGCPSDAELLRRISAVHAQASIPDRRPRGAGRDGRSPRPSAAYFEIGARGRAGPGGSGRAPKFQRRHGRLPGSEWAVVALGKFGGCELTATSDLDLMLVYDCSGEEPCSDAPRPLPTSQYFNLLAQTVGRRARRARQRRCAVRGRPSAAALGQQGSARHAALPRCAAISSRMPGPTSAWR